MNNKKIIFFVILWILLFSFVIIVLNLWWDKKVWPTRTTSGNFKIWIFDDNKNSFTDYVNEFKSDYGYNTVVEVTSFNNWEEYNLALSSAFIRWEGPDVFVLNNNEKSIFLENISWIDPNLIDPDDFLSNYKWVFSDDLMISTWEKKEKLNFLVWVPIWYESLWIFYDRIKVQPKDLENWASLNAKIAELKEKRKDIIPLWIWDGSTVKYSQDIITQFFMLEDITSIKDISSSEIRAWLWDYFSFWSSSWNNSYIYKASKLSSWSKGNIELFSRWEVSMIIWYPRMLLDIDESGYSKRLFARPFPEYIPNKGMALINYNYFVVNKNSLNSDISFNLLKYMTSNKGITSYLDKFPYYLPAYTPLESEYLDIDILNWYDVKLENFYNEDLILSSFDKGIKYIYDKEVIKILDDNINYIDSFVSFIGELSCITDKIVNLGDLSRVCK